MASLHNFAEPLQYPGCLHLPVDDVFSEKCIGVKLLIHCGELFQQRIELFRVMCFFAVKGVQDISAPFGGGRYSRISWNEVSLYVTISKRVASFLIQ